MTKCSEKGPSPSAAVSWFHLRPNKVLVVTSIQYSPPFAFRPDLSLGTLAVPRMFFCSSSFFAKVSLRATEVLRCWSSSQAGFFFFGCVDEVKKRLKELLFGFTGCRSLSLSRWPPLIPDDDAGVALLLLFALLLRKPPKKGIVMSGGAVGHGQRSMDVMIISTLNGIHYSGH